MHARRAGGRKYSDPDLISLIDSEPPDTDPFEFVRLRARALLETLTQMDGGFDTPLERMRAIASLAGYHVAEMDAAQAVREARDAVFVPTNNSRRRGLILYNPHKIGSRILHSIGHEIIHSFFPNSRTGAQFRSLTRRSDGPPPELEQLCDFGAAELTMPEGEFNKAVNGLERRLAAVETLRRRFGTSFEATAYRLATTADEAIAVGLFCYRAPKGRVISTQGTLFGEAKAMASDIKYRRQSFHKSRTYPQGLVLPWNKSLPRESVVYTAPRSTGVVAAIERLPVKATNLARFSIEAVVAPYQPPNVAVDRPNLLVMFRTA